MSAIILDLETCPIDDAATYVPPPPEIPLPDLSAITAAKNLVDPVKILADLEKRRASALADYEAAVSARGAKYTKQIADSALDPDLCRIVCLGYLTHESVEPVMRVCKDEHDERQALAGLWQQINATTPDVITFNGFRFDLPVIMRRSLYLGMPWRVLSVDRYRSQHIDLWQRLTFNGQITGHSLSFYAQRFGLGGDLDVHGSEIPAMVKAMDWAGIAAHCRQDVLWTAGIAKKLGVWDGVAEQALPDAVGF
jgi:hypothetical protein